MSSRTRKTPKRYRTLREWREARDLTLVEAAEYLELPLTSYYNFERGLRHPRPDALRRILDRTGVSIEVLAGVA